eukprot:m.1488047 g.1488047  ORF g.1488047 m.1488047 type:complete len:174 (+) comp25186_c0_seq1:275-796(+)
MRCRRGQMRSTRFSSRSNQIVLKPCQQVSPLRARATPAVVGVAVDVGAVVVGVAVVDAAGGGAAVRHHPMQHHHSQVLGSRLHPPSPTVAAGGVAVGVAVGLAAPDVAGLPRADAARAAANIDFCDGCGWGAVGWGAAAEAAPWRPLGAVLLARAEFFRCIEPLLALTDERRI